MARAGGISALRMPHTPDPAAPLRVMLIDDAAGRLALREQQQFALDGEPDPWFEFEKAQVGLRQFAPLQPGVAVEQGA